MKIKTIPIKSFKLTKQKQKKTTFHPPKFSTIQMKKTPRKTISLSPPKTFPANMRTLSYQQAKLKFPNLAPFGDADKDHVVNAFDCRPFDYDKHRLTEEQAKMPVFSWKSGLQTGRDVEQRLIKTLPMVFEEGTESEERLTRKLGSALEKRKQLSESKFAGKAPIPFSKLVGEHKVNVEFDQTETKLVHALLIEYLYKNTSGKAFQLDPSDPKNIIVIEHDPKVVANQVHNSMKRDPAYRKAFNQLTPEQQAKIMEVARQQAYKGTRTKSTFGKELNRVNAPDHILELLACFNIHTPITILITDDPTDVLLQSTQPKKPDITYEELKQHGMYDDSLLAWASCQRLGGAHESGAFADVGVMNAVAYIYFGDKTPGKDLPSGRLTMRWGENDNGELDVAIENCAYPWSKIEEDESKNALISQALKNALYKIAKKHGYAVGDVRVPKEYSRSQYSDTASNVSGASQDDYILFKPSYYKEPAPLDIDDEQGARGLLIKYSQQKAQPFPRPLWKYLSTDTSEKIRERMVQAPQDIPTQDLFPLAYDPSPLIQSRLAERPSLLEKNRDIYFSLMKREDYPITAKKKLLSTQIRKEDDKEIQLAPPEELWEDIFTPKKEKEDEIEDLRAFAVDQPYATPKMYNFLIETSLPTSLQTKSKIARKPNLPVPLISKLSSRAQPLEVRTTAVSRNLSKIPLRTLQGIVKSKNESDRRLARAAIASSEVAPERVIPLFESFSDPSLQFTFFRTNFSLIPEEYKTQMIMSPKTSSYFKEELLEKKTRLSLDELLEISKVLTPGANGSQWNILSQKLRNHLFKAKSEIEAQKIATIVARILNGSPYPSNILYAVKALKDTKYFNTFVPHLTAILQQTSTQSDELKQSLKETRLDIYIETATNINPSNKRDFINAYKGNLSLHSEVKVSKEKLRKHYDKYAQAVPYLKDHWTDDVLGRTFTIEGMVDAEGIAANQIADVKDITSGGHWKIPVEFLVPKSKADKTSFEGFKIGEPVKIASAQEDWMSWTPELTTRVGQKGTLTRLIPKKEAAEVEFSSGERMYFPVTSLGIGQPKPKPGEPQVGDRIRMNQEANRYVYTLPGSEGVITEIKPSGRIVVVFDKLTGKDTTTEEFNIDPGTFDIISPASDTPTTTSNGSFSPDDSLIQGESHYTTSDFSVGDKVVIRNIPSGDRQNWVHEMTALIGKIGLVTRVTNDWVLVSVDAGTDYAYLPSYLSIYERGPTHQQQQQQQRDESPITRLNAHLQNNDYEAALALIRNQDPSTDEFETLVDDFRQHADSDEYYNLYEAIKTAQNRSGQVIDSGVIESIGLMIEENGDIRDDIIGVTFDRLRDTFLYGQLASLYESCFRFFLDYDRLDEGETLLEDTDIPIDIRYGIATEYEEYISNSLLENLQRHHERQEEEG